MFLQGMRKAVFAASIVALLVVLYAAAGHWLAPRFVRNALVEQAQRAGLELRIEEVRTDPFALKVTLEDIRVLTGDGAELARAHSAAADIAWASLWRSWRAARIASRARGSIMLTGETA